MSPTIVPESERLATVATMVPSYVLLCGAKLPCNSQSALMSAVVVPTDDRL